MRALTVRTDEPDELARRLFEEHRVDVPVYAWDDVALLRVSIGPYVDDADIERLVEAVRETLRA
jgi:selenocysteine lyase/cysteine desulfurase